jgi:hypothetical protein
MNRRSLLGRMMAVSAGLVAFLFSSAAVNKAQAVVVRVRPRARFWINRHRRYLHYHLPRRRWW